MEIVFKKQFMKHHCCWTKTLYLHFFIVAVGHFLCLSVVGFANISPKEVIKRACQLWQHNVLFTVFIWFKWQFWRYEVSVRQHRRNCSDFWFEWFNKKLMIQKSNDSTQLFCAFFCFIITKVQACMSNCVILCGWLIYLWLLISRCVCHINRTYKLSLSHTHTQMFFLHPDSRCFLR